MLLHDWNSRQRRLRWQVCWATIPPRRKLIRCIIYVMLLMSIWMLHDERTPASQQTGLTMPNARHCIRYKHVLLPARQIQPLFRTTIYYEQCSTIRSRHVFVPKWGVFWLCSVHIAGAACTCIISCKSSLWSMQACIAGRPAQLRKRYCLRTPVSMLCSHVSVTSRRR